MTLTEQARQQKTALNAIRAELQTCLTYFQGPKFYIDTSVQTHEIISRLQTLKELAGNGLEGVTIQTADEYDSGNKMEVLQRGMMVKVHKCKESPFPDFIGKILAFNYNNELVVIEGETSVVSVPPRYVEILPLTMFV